MCILFNLLSERFLLNCMDIMKKRVDFRYHRYNRWENDAKFYCLLLLFILLFFQQLLEKYSVDFNVKVPSSPSRSAASFVWTDHFPSLVDLISDNSSLMLTSCPLAFLSGRTSGLLACLSSVLPSDWPILSPKVLSGLSAFSGLSYLNVPLRALH